MPSEIEHKYLVLKEAWKPSTSGVLYRPGYLSSTKTPGSSLDRSREFGQPHEVRHIAVSRANYLLGHTR